MTDARLAEIRELANKGHKGMPSGEQLLIERMYSSLALADAIAEIDRLRSEVKTLEDAHPFRNYKPSNHEATGNDIVDRLRGIYRTPINDGAGPLNGKDHYERRFAVGELSHHAADHIENLKRGLIEANKDTERLEWLDRASPDELDRLVDNIGMGRTRLEIDRATQRKNNNEE